MPSVGEVFQLAVRFFLPGDETAMNIYDIQMTSGSGTDAQLLTAASTWVSGMYAELASHIRSTVSLVDCHVVELEWALAEWSVKRIVGDVYPSFTPTSAANMLPHASAAVVEFPTTKPRVVGKKYIPGLNENIQDESDLSAGLLTDLSDYALVVLGGLGVGTGGAHYGVRRKTGDFEIPDTAFIPYIISSQKRRKPGVGV